ncbi:hypothetical protein IKF04_02660 [Candidatus Saccharibacteria bacterium]|nr:hypothetical protein [Candidatus Saccharibacteria bacterium]
MTENRNIEKRNKTQATEAEEKQARKKSRAAKRRRAKRQRTRALIGVVTIIVALSIILLAIHVFSKNRGDRNVVVLKPTELYGMDVDDALKTEYHVALNRQDLSDLVLFRATTNYYQDELPERAFGYAETQKKMVGIYFEWNDFDRDPTSCALFSAGIAQKYPGALCALAVAGDDIDPDWVLDWLKKFELFSGVRPLIRLSLVSARRNDWSEVIQGGYNLWIAAWGANDGENYGVPDIGDWPRERIVLHQFAYESGFGRDVFFGDEAAWRAYSAKRDLF